MAVAAKLDLTGDAAIEIGADYSIVIKTCNQPDLVTGGYVGSCQIKDKKTGTIVLSPTISIIDNTHYSINASFTNTLTVTPGDYDYDVRFVSNTNTFYSVRGYVTVIKTFTKDVVV